MMMMMMTMMMMMMMMMMMTMIMVMMGDAPPQKESVNLDDDMKTACLHDRERFCAAVKPGKGAVSAT